MELGIPKTIIHRILIEKLGLRKLNSKFVPHRLTDDQKLNRIGHCRDIIRETQRDENFLKTIVTGDETWCFQYNPETKRQSAEWRSPDEGNPKKSCLEKSKIKTMLIVFYDSKGIIHKEFVPSGTTVTAEYYLAVLKRLVGRVHRIRPEYREPSSWRLLHDNAPAHRSLIVTDFLTKNDIFLLQHPPYSLDLALCDYFLFPKLHLAMKGNRFASIEDIQRSTTSNLNIIPINDIKRSFNALLERANCCISAEGEYFE
ncbi:Mariner Mos1 transposase [Anthophora plagiata]